MNNVYCSCVKSCTGRRLHQPNVSEDTTVRYYFNGINRKECFSMVKHLQNVTYRLPFFKLFCVLPINVVQTSILMMINVFVFRVLARVSRFIISIGILDLQLQEIYGMSALCTRSDSVESGHTSDGSPMFERRRLAVY